MSTNDVVLIGSGDNLDRYAADANAMIQEKGAQASWWSFPLQEKYLPPRGQPLYLYLNAGGGRFPYRVTATDWQTQPGTEGMVSPWPDITSPDERGKTRAGPKESSLFKTWLKVVAVEKLDPPRSLDDFDHAFGKQRSALLLPKAFGYARLRGSQSVRAKNLILYGPPGTGKTFWLTEKFKEYTDDAQVDRETWLQELVGPYGWRPVIAVALADLNRPVRVGEIRAHELVAAKALQRGRRPGSFHTTIWAFLQEHTPRTVETVESRVRREPFIFSKRESSEWELLESWREEDEEAAALFDQFKAGPKAAAEPVRRYRVVTFHPSFSYEDFIRGIRPVASSEEGTTQCQIVDGVFKQICDEARSNPQKRYALFIDEINRANIAKVFGELITLIEPDKRAVYDVSGRRTSGMVVQLPGSQANDVADPEFDVPANLDIYGTMNTADRSIALLDVALRRRFEFQEMEPEYGLLKPVGTIDVGEMLRRINDRLEYLIDREHRIGHAYLMRADSLDDLRTAFRLKIIPLLQEYFFDDFGRVAAVLTTDPAAPKFIETEDLEQSKLFGRAAATIGETNNRSRYRLTPYLEWTEESFRGIYMP